MGRPEAWVQAMEVIGSRPDIIQMEPEVAAPGGDSEDENADFFANFKEGIDFEDTEQSHRAGG